MKKLVIIAFLLIGSDLQAQTDSLVRYNLAQLDSLYKTKKKSQEQLPYALAMLQKGEKELDTKDTSYAKLLYKVGYTYQNLRDIPNATTYLEKSIAIWQQKMPMHLEHANSLNSLGLVYVYQGKHRETEKYWLEAIEIRKKILGEKHPDYASALNNLANLNRIMAKYAVAEAYYTQGMGILKEALGEKNPSYATGLNNWASLYQDMGNYAVAEPLYKQAIEIQKEILGEKHPDYAGTLNNLAFLYYRMGKHTAAEPLYKKSMGIRKEVLGVKHSDYAASLLNLALLYKVMGNYTAAEPMYKESVEINKKFLGEKHPDYARSLNNLALLYKSMGNYAIAEPLYKEAMQIRKETLGEKHPDYAFSLNNLADLYRNIGNYSLAETLEKQALQIRKEALGEKHPDYARSLNSLADLYRSMGDYASAEPLMKQVTQIWKGGLGEKHNHYASGLISFANLYYDMGNYVAAEPLYKQAMEIFKENFGDKHNQYAVCLNNLASVYIGLGDYAQAEKLYNETLIIRKDILGEKHPDYAMVLTNLANMYYDMRNYAKAEPFYHQAIEIYKESLGEQHPDYAKCLFSLGRLYTAIGSYNATQIYFAKLLALRLNYIDKQGATLGEKAKQELFKTVAPHIDQVNYFAAFHRQQDSLLVLVQDGLLATKGYALAGVSELLPLIKTLKDSSLIATYNVWTFTKTQLGKAYEMSIAERAEKRINMDSLQNLTKAQESLIMNASAAIKERLGYDKKRFYYKDLIKSINKSEVTIDFVRFENEKKDTAWYYALVNQQGWTFPKYIALCLESQLLPYANAQINPNSPSYITQSERNKELYDLLIKPLEPYFKKKKIIHWAPTGVMNQISMGILRDSKGKMLGEKMEIHQYGSLKDFIIKKTGEGSTGNVEQNVLLVGDIAFDLNETEHVNLAENSKDENFYAMRSFPTDSIRGATRFIPLKGTKIEVENLSQAFSSKKWKINHLQQKDALEEKVREYTGNKTPKVLHFATHGFFIPAKKQGYDNPLLRSGIALAGANRVWMGKPRIEGVEDGLWTAYEIANIDLSPAELVVLSACETAKGQIDPHEGVLGLQRSFKIAGVENMLLSLWQVPDKETVELMQEFYKHYLNGETPSVSLHKAQDTMRKKYPEPYYWAAFILIE